MLHIYVLLPFERWVEIKIEIESRLHCFDQGTNARKVISEVYAFFYCSVLSLGVKVNSRWLSHPDIESIFTKIIYEIFWSKETIK